MKTKYVPSARKRNLWPLIPLGVTLVVLGSSLRSPPQFELASSTSGVQLGTAGAYSVLAATTVTNTGATTLAGDLGLSPGTSVTGFPPGTVAGTTNINNSAAVTAETATTNAYLVAAGMTPATTEVADLAGLTLSPGIYAVPAATSNLTGTLTLNGQGNPNAIFVFQLPSTLITSSSSKIVLTNSANPCNIFWQVTSSATLGTSSVFQGTILALTSIAANTSATIDGRLLARNGAVTLDSNTITNPVCTTSTTTTPPATTTTTPPKTTTTPPKTTTTPPTTTTTPPTTTTTPPTTTTTPPSPITISTGPLSPPASHTDALPIGLAIGGVGLAGLGYLFVERKRRQAASSNEVA
ncbi:ice-binding family protein [Ferrimicrobium acidiphilum]|uniref:ice-binding family protein n=1 Tax=Ferrimicrobium acidiphilum TaxID=121039 RepID=UPI000696EB01|nr:ice-binding family protein [Ferrimicrobium acidiphilum]